jgi:hypothetical protein
MAWVSGQTRNEHLHLAIAPSLHDSRFTPANEVRRMVLGWVDALLSCFTNVGSALINAASHGGRFLQPPAVAFHLQD